LSLPAKARCSRHYGSLVPGILPSTPSGPAAAPLFAPASCLREQDCCLEPLGHLSELFRGWPAAASAHPIRSAPSPAPRAPCATAPPAPRS